MSKEVGDTLTKFVNPADSVRVVLHPIEAAWYVEGAVMQALREAGRTPSASAFATYELDLGLLNVKVVYTNLRWRGFFGTKILDRTVSVGFSAKVVEKKSGVIVLHDNVTRSVSDTVEASEVENLENPAIAATHGILPREGFFTTIFEPFIAMGAIAVAVYLLFHVRS